MTRPNDLCGYAQRMFEKSVVVRTGGRASFSPMSILVMLTGREIKTIAYLLNKYACFSYQLEFC